MNTVSKIALIDTYSVDDCIALLAAFAPDLLLLIADDVRMRRNDPQTLKKARKSVRVALAREHRAN